MEFQLDSDWRVQPIKGDTGKTYIGYRDEDRVFIKRNTTPMLAALSREESHQSLFGSNEQEMVIH